MKFQDANAHVSENEDNETADDANDAVNDSSESKPRQKPRMALTRNLKRPTEYVQMMNGEFSEWAFNEERAPTFKGKWREEIFKAPNEAPIDLEIGTGNGYHFAHLAQKNPDRLLVGIELKFKPLIQSIRRALRGRAKNARIARYDAVRVDDLFAEGELNNVYIHHPDPWEKERQWKHRLIQDEFLVVLYNLMRPGTYIDFKTDSRDYYDWSIVRFHRSPFKVTRETIDLHHSEWKDENFVTHFESIFLAKGQPIHYARLVKE